MNYKKSFVIFLGLILMSALVMAAEEQVTAVGSAAGYGDSVNNFLTGTINTISPITGIIFGANKSTGDNGFIALMAFLLTLLVIAGVLTPIKIFGDKGWINWTIAIIVALIGIRFVPIEMLRSFTIPAEGLVGALFLIIPFFVVALLILKAQHTGVRKALWAVYGVVMITLLVYHWDQTGTWSSFYWVYVAIIAVCTILFLMDGTIQKFLRQGETARQYESINSREADRIEARISDLETAMASATTDAQRARIKTQIDAQRKNLKALINN